MNWITTNIRFPKDLYMELKLQAARERKSIAAIVREKFSEKSKPKKVDVKRKLEEMDELAEENGKYIKGKSLSELLIEMRYEQ